MTADEVLNLDWIRALSPVRAPSLRQLSDHSDLQVWHVHVEFRSWPIPIELRQRWEQDDRANANETWKKRPLVHGDASGCPYSCGEVELAGRLRRAGFHAFWISEWSGFPQVPCWSEFCVKRNEFQARCPEGWAFDRDLRVASPWAQELGKSGGHPDVITWSEKRGEFCFLEYKGPGDSIKLKQNLWAQAVVAQNPGRIPYVAVLGSIEGK